MKIKALILKNSPIILLGTSIVGYLASMVMVAKISSKLERKRKILKRLPQKERLIFYVKAYSPSVAISGLTIMAMIGGHKIHVDRAAAAVSVYQLLKTNFQDYRDGVRTEIGEKKEKLIQGKVSEARMSRRQIPENITGNGSVLCYDDLSGRFFFSEMESIRQAQNNFNETLINGDTVKPLNDLYYEFGLPPIKLGENIGWEIGRKLVALEFDTKLTTNGRPCLVIRHKNIPELIW